MSLIQSLKSSLKAREARKDVVFGLYNHLVDQARQPKIYQKFDIPDTLDGRFDSICLHIAVFGLATNAAIEGDEDLADIGKDIIGVFLKDMDRNLREIGVGDLSVGKKVKKMASALYGRIDAYSTALVQKNQKAALADALSRNLYRGDEVSKTKLNGLAEYSLGLFKEWQKLKLDAIRALAREGRNG